MQSATYRAFRGHSSKRVVKAFKKDFDNRRMSLFLALKDGSWKERLSYRSLVKVNNNGRCVTSLALRWRHASTSTFF